MANSEALCVCPCSFDFIFLNSKFPSEKVKELFINFYTFDFRPRYLLKYANMGDFPPKNFFLGCVEALHQMSASHIECKWKKAVSSKDSLSIFCWNPILSSALIRIWFHHQIKSSCWPYSPPQSCLLPEFPSKW